MPPRCGHCGRSWALPNREQGVREHNPAEQLRDRDEYRGLAVARLREPVVDSDRVEQVVLRRAAVDSAVKVVRHRVVVADNAVVVVAAQVPGRRVGTKSQR